MPLQLVAVGGLPGAGKSVAAREIAARLNAVLLRTDVVRKELYPAPSYTPKEGERVYEHFLAQADEQIAQGRSVVLDATFRQESLRWRAEQIARVHGAIWHLILVHAPESRVRSRIAGRTNDPSDADFRVYLQLREEFEPIHGAHTVLENLGTLDDLYQQIHALFPASPQRTQRDGGQNC
jgi:predicted kinase